MGKINISPKLMIDITGTDPLSFGYMGGLILKFF